MALVSYRGAREKNRWMLKDYLRDDVSSCSSNGFRSFPRRQCCVAARSIIESEVIRNHQHHHHHHHTKKRMLVKNDCNFSYALQRASTAVVNAVKLLPFNSAVKTTEDDNNNNKRFLPRSFSKKLFRRSFFWKKDDKNSSNKKKSKNTKKNNEVKFDDEIERWISSSVVGKEKYQPLDLSNDTTVTNNSSTSMSNSEGKSRDDSSWSDITFSSDSSENDDVERTAKMDVSKIVAVIGAHSSVQPAVNQENVWFDEEVEKQHTSPVSVLDFPDKDGGSFSPFTPQASRAKAKAKERLMEKLGKFEYLTGLEPVNLESLFLSPKLQDRAPQCSIQPCSTPSYILSSASEDEEDEEGEEGESEESEVEKHAQYLLKVTKSNVTMSSNSSYKFELENVLLDYFRQNVTQKESHSLLKAAEDWLNGHYDNLILGWKAKDKRQAYIRDMEEGGWWPNDTKLEREEIGANIGDEVFERLIQELMVDL